MFRPLFAFLHPQQDFAGEGLYVSGRYVLAGGGDEVGHIAQRHVVFTQATRRNLDVGDILGHVSEVCLADCGVTQKPVPQPLRQFPKGPGVYVAVQADLHDLAFAGLELDLRLLGFVGERGDSTDGLVDVLIDRDPVCAGHQFDRHTPPALVGRRGDFLDALDAADGLLDGQQNARLHLGRRGTGVRDADVDDIELELWFDFLLDILRRPEAAGQQEQHQQVGRDRIAGHPCDGSALFGRLVTAVHARVTHRFPPRYLAVSRSGSSLRVATARRRRPWRGSS